MSNPHRTHACASELQTRLDQLEKDQSSGEKRVRHLRRLSQCLALTLLLPLVCTLTYLGRRYVAFELGYQAHVDKALMSDNVADASAELEAASRYFSKAHLPSYDFEHDPKSLYLKWLETNIANTMFMLQRRPTTQFMISVPATQANQYLSSDGWLHFYDPERNEDSSVFPFMVSEVHLEDISEDDLFLSNGCLRRQHDPRYTACSDGRRTYDDPYSHWEVIDGRLYHSYRPAFDAQDDHREKYFQFTVQREIPMSDDYEKDLLDRMRVSLTNPPTYMQVDDALWIYPYSHDLWWILGGSITLMLASIGMLFWIKRTFP